jgi:hypothetical protein
MCRIKTTYLDHATAYIDEDRGGRYSAAREPARVIGAAPISYPMLPQGSPANQAAMVPDEPLIDGSGEGVRLGYRIDDMGMGSATAPAQGVVEGPAAAAPKSPVVAAVGSTPGGFKRRI